MTGTQDTYAALEDALNEAKRLAKKLAEEHDERVDERDDARETLDDLDKTARDAGYADATEAMDALASRNERGELALMDHHDANHGGPLRFCADRLCSSFPVAS